MAYETSMIAPAYFDSPEDADFLIERIRDLGLPIIVARFYDVSGNEAQVRVGEINVELGSRGLPQFPPVRYTRRKEE